MAVGLFLISFAARAAGEADGNPGTPWPASDALGRTLPAASEIKPPRPNRTVGIFYFLTHGRDRTELPHDIAKILAQDPDVLSKPDSPLWGPPGSSYYWGEPLYGYYNSTDPWVLRRHAQLLADAGIDTVIFDTTNRRTYPEVYFAICKVWSQIRKEGGRTPQICFMVNTKAGETAQEIYRDLYQPGLYPELWFRWQGKPLLICDPAEASAEVKKFFTLRAAHWPFELVNTHNGWHWESTYPQVFSYDTDKTRPEQVNVAVAQNLRAEDGKVTNMSEGNARGRSFHDGKKDTSSGAVNQGFNFAEQWQRALELDAPFVMVTGWNEWTAGKYSRPGLPVVFVDQYDQEYSRDIEPVTGLHNDNYYYQLVANVRRYKGAPALPVASVVKTINIAGDFKQWADVGPEFTDHAFDTDHRDFGKGAVHYTNASGRNDLTRMKVARDATNIFFYAQTRQPIVAAGILPAVEPGFQPGGKSSARASGLDNSDASLAANVHPGGKMPPSTSGRMPDATGTNWMWLLLDTDHNPKTGWEGYDFILNRSVDGQETWLEKNTGGWNWERVAKISFTVRGNELMLAVPRAALGLSGTEDFTLDFKWWDNAQKSGDIMDTYLSGDAAPDGRFNFRYEGDTTKR